MRTEAPRRPAAPRLARRSLLAAGVALLMAAWWPAAQAAGGIEQLRAFLTGTQSARGEFTQRVARRDGTAVGQPARGSFVFQRPGRFRWTYEQPYEQVLVSDGQRLWMYDRDLNQVTVRKLAASLPASPASILFGANDFEREFEVAEDGGADGLAWIAARPRTRDSTFERIRIGFRDGLPAAMELVDGFGQTSRLAFSKLERNPRLDAETFRFVPPKGADVLEDK
jgi:outer membrane lipoprotein carrier protein